MMIHRIFIPLSYKLPSKPFSSYRVREITRTTTGAPVGTQRLLRSLIIDAYSPEVVLTPPKIFGRYNNMIHLDEVDIFEDGCRYVTAFCLKRNSISSLNDTRIMRIIKQLSQFYSKIHLSIGLFPDSGMEERSDSYMIMLEEKLDSVVEQRIVSGILKGTMSKEMYACRRRIEKTLSQYSKRYAFSTEIIIKTF